MEKLPLEKVTVVLFNPAGPMRATLRDALLSVGFRNIHDFASIERTRQAIADHGPDVLFLDLDSDKDGVCRLSREIRKGGLHRDPYAIIIALSWQPYRGRINSSMEAGIDDLITMPLSLQLIRDRIMNLIQNRKPFIVTPSYIGPDRRSSGDRVSDDMIGTIAVPNGLRFKATGDMDAEPRRDVIREIQERIQTHRIGRHAQKIIWLIDRTGDPQGVGRLRHGRDGIGLRQCLDEISNLLDVLERACAALDLESLEALCHSMRRLHGHLRKSHTPRMMELMRLHAHAFIAALMDHEGAAEIVIEALNEATGLLARETHPA